MDVNKLIPLYKDVVMTALHCPFAPTLLSKILTFSMVVIVMKLAVDGQVLPCITYTLLEVALVAV